MTTTKFPVLDAYGNLRRSLAQLAHIELKNLKIGIKQMAILYCLVDGKATTSSQLAEITRSDRATISRCLSSMIKAGLVQRKTDPKDRRFENLALSAAGRRKAEKALDVRARLEKILASALTPEEQILMPQLLNKIALAVNESLGLKEKES